MIANINLIHILMKKITDDLSKRQPKNRLYSILFMLVACFILGYNANAQSPESFSSNGTFKVPVGVTNV